MGRRDERFSEEPRYKHRERSCGMEEAVSTVAQPMSEGLHEAEDPEAGAHMEIDAVKFHQQD